MDRSEVEAKLKANPGLARKVLENLMLFADGKEENPTVMDQVEAQTKVNDLIRGRRKDADKS